MKKIYYLILLSTCLCLSVVINSCGGDDNIFNEDSFYSYYFELTIEDKGKDQAEVIMTTIEYVDYKGNVVTDTFNDQGDGTCKITSHEFTSVPVTNTITITQRLRSGLTYDKDSYVLGQLAILEISSINKAGNIISRRTTELENTQTIKATNLGKVFPKATKFTYSVAKDGTITLK